MGGVCVCGCLYPPTHAAHQNDGMAVYEESTGRYGGATLYI